MESLERIELRAASLIELQQVARVLDEDESWKKFMSMIPIDLTDDNNFQPKYNTEHIKIIENAGIKQNRSCTEILFEEWGTSGRVRPTIGILLKLLIKSEFYRAADIVSVQMLKGKPVKRPLTGPAAAVDLSITKLLIERETNKKDMEKFLDNMQYPSTIRSIKTFDNNLDYDVNKRLDKNIDAGSVNSNSTGTAPTEMTSIASSISDMIKFSGNSAPSQSSLGYVASVDRPAFSILLQNNESTQRVEAVNTNITDSSESYESSFDSKSAANVPNFELINASIQLGTNQSEQYIPMLSALQNAKSESNFTPSLNTTLPHFSYEQLKAATNNFDDRMYDNGTGSGCKLGAGGTGAVYIADGLFGHPVAVKKLIVGLGNYSEVILTNQFKVEVELLSKYKHEHLLELLGYSADGPNNCLVYEYLEGGSLQNGIAESDELYAAERMRIALGTARGIEYLHYGFEKPLIHRDVKTANILLTAERKPKLCDFGLVKTLSESSQSFKLTSTIMGTNAYMAQEAFRGDISTKMDVYSFGVVLLELLTGLPPMDKDRPGKDLVTYIEMCEGVSDEDLVDKRAGHWENLRSVFELSKKCIELKMRRPSITEVTKELQRLLN